MQINEYSKLLSKLIYRVSDVDYESFEIECRMLFRPERTSLRFKIVLFTKCLRSLDSLLEPITQILLLEYVPRYMFSTKSYAPREYTCYPRNKKQVNASHLYLEPHRRTYHHSSTILRPIR